MPAPVTTDKGVIVYYNYDRILERQQRFPVIVPHGQRSALLDDPKLGPHVRRMVLEHDGPFPVDWHLPVPEGESIRARPDYLAMLAAWKNAGTVVFVGYGFGGGADGISFDDFGRHVAVTARIHVLCPAPDNADLCKQIGHCLPNRGARFKVYGQPFRWRSFAGALLDLLRARSESHVRAAIGHEAELGYLHDRC